MRRIYCFFIICLCSMMVSAQDMKSVFINMPDSIIPLLTKINREDCVDFLASDMKALVKNRFDKQAELKVLTNDYLLMQATEVSTIEMKLLPVNDSVKVICMVKTLSSPVSDSEIKFYGTDWKQLASFSYVKLPIEDAFYLPIQDESYLLYRKKADLYLLELSLNAESAILSCKYTTPLYLNEEDRGKLEPYLRKEPIVLNWVNGCFQ